MPFTIHPTHTNTRIRYYLSALFAIVFLMSLGLTAHAQSCPCSAIKLGVDTTKGMKFDTVAYRSSKDSTKLLYDYASTKIYLRSLPALLYDSISLDPNEVQQLRVKSYGTRIPLPYDYISYVTVSRSGKKMKDFKYKLTLVLKDSAVASDTLLLDTLHENSLSRITADLDSMTNTTIPLLKKLQKLGKIIGVDTIRGVQFDDRAYQDAPNHIADYAQASGIAAALLGFYTHQRSQIGLQVVPFGFVEGDIDLGKGVSGNGTNQFGVVKIKNNYWVLDTITMVNTTSDTIVVNHIALASNPSFALDTILPVAKSMTAPLPASIPVGGSLQAVLRICHGADTTMGSTEPIITDQMTVSTASNGTQMFTLQAQPVHSSYDYVSSVTLDRKGKTLKDFYYKLTLLIKDAATGDTVLYDTLDDAALSNIPQDLNSMVQAFSPTLHLLRNFQSKIRADSADHYIALKYTIMPAKSKIKSNESTDLLIKVFDCDGTPAAGKHFAIKLKAGNKSQLSPSQITTDGNGSAIATLTGGPDAEVAKVSVDYGYISVTHHVGKISDCGSKSVTVGAPYTLTVEASLQIHGVDNAAGNHGNFEINGTAPMELQITPSDTCGKWVFLDDVTFTMTGSWVEKDGTTCTFNGGSYTSPATFEVDGCRDGSSGTLHIDHIGPSTEDYSCPHYSPSGAAGGVNVILLGVFNATKMAAAQADGQDKIANIKALAAKAQAERAAGDPNARADYMALLNAAKAGGMGGGMSSGAGGLSGLSFEFKDAVNKQSSPVFDYSPPLDEANGTQDKVASAKIHVKIEKEE